MTEKIKTKVKSCEMDSTSVGYEKYREMKIIVSPFDFQVDRSQL